MRKTYDHNSVLGVTDEETVKLDFDNTSFKTVRFWALRAMHWHDLEGFVILKSSENSYHVIFNRRVLWAENLHIIAWVSLLSHHEGLKKWCLMQCIKESSTLRVSTKKGKPSPRIVFRYGRQKEQIQAFLDHRRLVKNIIRRLGESEVSTPVSPENEEKNPLLIFRMEEAGISEIM